LRLLHLIDAGAEVPADLRDCLEGAWLQRLTPGPFPWHADEYVTPRLPWTLRLLDGLAAPWPGCSCDLDGRAVLTVRNCYPHADYTPHGPERFVPRSLPPGPDTSERLQPALRCRLTSAGRAEEFWVGLAHGAAPVRLGDDLYLVRYRPD